MSLIKIPYYLTTKLNSIAINGLGDLLALDYLEVFSKLRLQYPSLGYQALYDLYLIFNPNADLNQNLKKELITTYLNLPKRYFELAPGVIDKYLNLALENAKMAANLNEVPIGAVITCQNEVIATGFNQTISGRNILLHAEIKAIEKAQQKLNNYRLNECDLYVTLEPCLMCSGAIINSRIKRLVFGALEPKTGAVISQYQTFKNRAVNHHCEVIGPVDNLKYKQIITDFFKNK